MDKSRGIRKGCAPAASRHRAASPSGLKAFGFSRSGIDWRGALLDDGTDPFNRVCTHIAIIMLGGLLAIYLETFL